MFITHIILQNSEYTGENRCAPCTILNLLIAVTVAVVIGAISAPVGIVAFVIFVGSIYFRGYLVPGTPALTKRYLPDWVLRLFDKDSLAEPMPKNVEMVDNEAILKDAGAVSECENHDDLCLTPEFRIAWRNRIEQLREDSSTRMDLAVMLGVDEGQLTFERYRSAFVAMRDGTHIGQWESHGAFLADLAAATELEGRYSSWKRLDLRQQSSLLSGLRLFLEQCPSCDGPVTLNKEIVESCCRSANVVAATCQECSTRLFEAEQPADWSASSA